MLIQELGGNARPSPVHDKVQKQNKDEQANHELQIFSFESISIATSNGATVTIPIELKEEAADSSSRSIEKHPQNSSLRALCMYRF
ncbi:hypothetical protein SO802_005575 [Lithocarpus litseifolius]|uniref:Uncharacterized protein n=1 Tax=Lithocarpus litseifolius TaxID=425828 RepID=A0AAW2DIY4_9ROSI